MEFTKDDIIDAIDAVLFETMPDLTNIISISIFVTSVGKKLLSTIDSRELLFEGKMTDLISGICKKICDELEERTLITFELAQECREVLGNTEEVKMIFNKIMSFFNSDTILQPPLSNYFKY